MKGPFELCHPGHWIQGREPRQMILTNIARLLLPSCASLVVQRLKCLPAMWETWVQSLGQEDPLETERATHCSILAWQISWPEEPGRLQSMGLRRVGHDLGTTTTKLALSFVIHRLVILTPGEDRNNIKQSPNHPLHRSPLPSPVLSYLITV